MRLVVTGREGQVATALAALAGEGVEVVRLGRPGFDLERLETIAPALEAARPDVVVSAAAYTAVDQAESEPERARAANGAAPGVIAEAARRLGAPVIQLSTDYVFDGTKDASYLETDATGPQTVYGSTKLEGEAAVAAAGGVHLILRTAWVYAPGGKNFVRTMLRLAESREEVSVVADQRGCPTYAPDIAEAVLRLARALRRGEGASGVYNLAGAGEASWAEFAQGVFEGSRARGGPSARVRPIATADYPTPARRPANSRLDGAKLRETFGVVLPSWREALPRCLDALVGPVRAGETA
jgi:dTDP-4-dehydrorhamnose reductase